MSEYNGVPLDKLAKIYIKLREKKSQIKAEFDEQYNKLSEDQDMIKTALLEYCKENNLEGFKTAFGTVSRTVRSKYWTSDWSSMYEFVLEHEVPEFFEKRLNQSAVKAFLEENPKLTPKGLNTDSEYSISITKPRKPRTPRT